MTAEAKARDLLRRMGVQGTEFLSSGDLVELANLCAGVKTAMERESTEWFVVKPGFSVVIKDEHTELQRVFFNVLRVTSCDGWIILVNQRDGTRESGRAFPTGRYRLCSIKRQTCAE